MNRFVVVAFLLFTASITSACLTSLNPVIYTREVGAPSVPPRPEGCVVEVHDENGAPPRPHLVIGRLELDWSATRMKEQGAAGAIKTLQTAGCEYGGHYIVNLRVLSRGFKEGFLYESDLALLLDENGDPLVGKATGTSSSSASVTGTSIEPTLTGSALPTTSAPSPAPTATSTP